MSRLRGALVAVSLTAAAAAAENDLTSRRAHLACGPSIITAQAFCYGDSPLCARETLTFRRMEGSTVLSPHPRTQDYPLHAGRKVAALDYRANSWACVEGANGGRYVAVVMVRAGGADCGECQYARLYHPNGRAIAATLRFDTAGRPSGDAKAVAVMREVLGRPWPEGLKLVHDR